MSYADAIFRVKRGFVIIGLTGYYNSGFKQVHNILVDNDKPELPAYGTLSEEKRTHLNDRLYKKLERTWNQLTWSPFIDIDLSKIIFCAVLDAATKGVGLDDPIIKGVRDNIIPLFSASSESFRLLWEDYERTTENHKKIISLYAELEIYHDDFRKLFQDSHQYITKMQDYGSALRQYGKIADPTSLVPSPDHLFIIPEAARRIIKALRTLKNENHFVIKSFKNPYEVEYFKRRYSEFYLLGTLRDFKKRDVRSIDKHKLDEIEKRERNEFISSKSKENISDWISHVNVKECLQKTDYFINCNLEEESKNRTNIKFNIVKLISLIKSPGCISPNFDERGMQIAMTARQVSRCISRQVGASIFDDKGFLVGIGWNDPPAGQVPCSLRTTKELLNDPPNGVFSDYERSESFQKHIKNTYGDLDVPFCFRQELPKSIKKEEKMSEYSRALHAEENAFFQALWNHGNKIMDGTLFVTDCTCNLCAKKSYQLGIKRILYIDEYPGYSILQTIKCGTRSITIDYFEGGTGESYFKLYTRLLQEKDLIQLYPKK